MSAIGVVEDLIALQRLAEQECDAAGRRSLDAVREPGRRTGPPRQGREPAQALGVSAPTVRAWIEAGALRTVAGSRPVPVGVMSLAVAKGVMDELRRHPDDQALLVDVQRVLRGREALAGEDVGAGLGGVRAGRFVGSVERPWTSFAREADPGIDVGLTRTAERQIVALRGRHAQVARQVLQALMARGCEEAGYRLAGAQSTTSAAATRRGTTDCLTAWPASDHDVILAVGPYDRSAQDVYELLLAAVAVDVPAQDRTKPPCCDELGEPPADAALAEALAAAVSALPPGRRGRR